MSKHTDGPWSFVVSDEDVYDITPTNDIGGVVAIAYDEANAKLIAAAPELLEALKRLLGATNVGNADEHDEGCRCVIHEARAAIAKATA